MSSNNQFATAIRTLRISKGIKQEVLAEQIGYSQSYLSELENGKHHFTLELLHKLAQVFQCEVSELVKLA
jgi:transcriptional regulator with XRE-family HTH domain